MQFIEDIKQKIGQLVFQKELKTNKRLKSVCNLDDAKSVGILYDATSEEQIKIIQPFVSYFFDLKKDVTALGYVNAQHLLKLKIKHKPENRIPQKKTNCRNRNQKTERINHKTENMNQETETRKRKHRKHKT